MPIFHPTDTASGTPIVWGRPVIHVQNPRINNNYISDSSRDITVAPPSGTIAYWTMLNSRYIIGPSGWNANGYLP